jgi:hypothetical protein
MPTYAWLKQETLEFKKNLYPIIFNEPVKGAATLNKWIPIIFVRLIGQYSHYPQCGDTLLKFLCTYWLINTVSLVLLADSQFGSVMW